MIYSYYDLSNGAIFNDIEWALSHISKHAIVQRLISQKWYEI